MYNTNIFEDENSILAKFSRNDNLDVFNHSNLANGTFFDEYSNSFNNSNNVENYLLNNMEAGINILKDNLSIPLIHSLIGKLILSKYLIDRGICEEDFFLKKYNCSFNEIILNKEFLFDFFDIIEKNFNQDLFKISPKQKDMISKKDLNVLYRLFSGFDIKNNKGVEECPYDFKFIPVELISDIYESFLNIDVKSNQKAFYTPLFLVDYILNRTLDKKLESDINCKILDPSCGSGVFLVESLRRLINSHLKLNRQLTSSQLKNILTNNIFGIDIDENAINMTILSIQLTIFDYLGVEEIRNFKMPKLLNKNFFVSDFFDEDEDFNQLSDFDLVIGNPPWGSRQDKHVEYFLKNNIPVSNKQIAQSFLVRVRDFINENSEVAFIVSSKILYNSRDSKFRKYFLKNFNLVEVFEFSSLRKEIFKKAVGSGSILFYNTAFNECDVKHISLKPNKLFYLLSSIVIQKTDIKFISQKDLMENDWVWKVLIYGNTLDFQLINRLHSKKTLGQFISENDLKASFGIQIGNKKYDASEYFNYDYLDVDCKMLNRYFIDENNVKKWNILKVERPRSKLNFTPPYILLKKTLNQNYQCVSTYSQKPWIFTDSVMSIKGRENDEKLLKCILGFLNSKFFTYFSFLTFSSIGVEREQIFLNEIESLPVVVNDELANYVDEMLKLPQSNIQNKIDDLILDLLSFNGLEKDLVDYFFDVTIPMFKKSNVYYEVSKETLESYIQIFLNHFNYYFRAENNEFFHVKCFISKEFVGINFIISENEPEHLIEYNYESDILNFFGNLSIEDRKDLYIQRDIKGFEESSFFVIKSNEYKNWHKAIGRRDVIEFTNYLMNIEDD